MGVENTLPTLSNNIFPLMASSIGLHAHTLYNKMELQKEA